MLRSLFAPRLIGLHVLAIVAVTAAGWLGWWQYDAWQTARAAAARDLVNAEPKPLGEVIGPDDPFPGNAVGQPVRLRGEWVEGSFAVSDQQLDGRDGYWAVTPVAVCDSDCDGSPAIPVVRGWVESPEAVPAPTGRVEVVGWLQPPQDSGRPDRDPRDAVLPELRIADAVQRVDRDLYGGYVIAEDVGISTRVSGLEPVTPAALPEPETFTSVRNLLYAIEWWVFGAFAGFLWWRWCRDLTEDAREVVSTGSTTRDEPSVSAGQVASRT